MFRFFVILLSMLISSAGFARDLKIVASIKPIASLIQGITENTNDQVTIILDDHYSPHSFSMKPSQIRMLHQADQIFYIHKNFETFIKKMIATSNPLFIALADADKIDLLKNRDLNLKSITHHSDHHHDLDTDYHIWLSPENAIKMTQIIQKRLSDLNPSKAELYQKNSLLVIASLEKLNKQISSYLKPAQQIPWIATHDAYQYFIKSFDLNMVGTLMINPSQPMTFNQIKTVQKILKISKPKCIFQEPQFSRNPIDKIIGSSDHTMKVLSLDPLGVGLVSNKYTYGKILYNMAKQIRDCAVENKNNQEPI